MPLINCELTLDLKWSENFEAERATTFAMTNAKFYIQVVTLSTKDNAKLLQNLKSDFKRTINFSRFQSKPTEAQNWYLDFLNSPSFQRVNSLFLLTFENEDSRLSRTRYYLPKVKNATDQGDNYATGCLLDYPYFNENLNLIAIDLNNQQALDAESRVIQQISFTRNLDRAAETIMFFILEEQKKIFLNLSKQTVQ